MKKLCIACASAALLCASPASAAVAIGQPCTPPGGGGMLTQGADDPKQGILACLLNANGGHFWQPTNAGNTLYDNSTTCSTAGQLRWNGSTVQFCNGSSWSNIGGSGFPVNHAAISISVPVWVGRTAVTCSAKTDANGTPLLFFSDTGLGDTYPNRPVVRDWLPGTVFAYNSESYTNASFYICEVSPAGLSLLISSNRINQIYHLSLDLGGYNSVANAGYSTLFPQTLFVPWN